MGRGDSQIDEVIRSGLDLFPERDRFEELLEALATCRPAGVLADHSFIARTLLGSEELRETISERAQEGSVQSFFKGLITSDIASDGISDISEFYARIYLAAGVEGSRTLFCAHDGSVVHTMPDLNSTVALCGYEFPASHYRTSSREKLAALPANEWCALCAEALAGTVADEQPYPCYSSTFMIGLTSDAADTVVVEDDTLWMAAIDTAARATKYSGTPEEILTHMLSFARMTMTGRIASQAEHLFKQQQNRFSRLLTFGISADSPNKPFFEMLSRDLSRASLEPVGSPNVIEALHRATKSGTILDHEITRSRFIAYYVSESWPLFGDRFSERMEREEKARALLPVEQAMFDVFKEKGHLA